LGQFFDLLTVFFDLSKLVRKPGNLLTSIKDPVDIKSLQGLVYSIPCCDYNKRYIGET